MSDNAITASPWQEWRAVTPARIALGRAGNAMPTGEVLRLGLAHALARDAIETELDVVALTSTLAAQGWETVCVRSQATDRATYLKRPDLGRRIDADAAEDLRRALARPKGVARIGPFVPDAFDLCFVVADGLSSLAATRHAVPLLAALRPRLPTDTRIAPLVIATQARVALADDIGELTGARLVAILLGERPGLSSPDSLGIYLTYAPRRGRTDAERNCISNVRPEGLGYEDAAAKLAWLICAACRRGLTGVALKDESEPAITGTSDPRPNARDAALRSRSPPPTRDSR